MKEEIKEERYRIKISWETMAITDNFCWIASDYYNGLFRIPTDELRAKENKVAKLEFCGIFPNETNNKRLWSWIEAYNHYLIFVPLMANNFTIYNTEDGGFTSVEILPPSPKGFPTVKYSPTAKFSFCVCKDNRVIYFPYYYPAFAVMDLDSMNVKYIDTPIKMLSQSLKGDGPYFWRSTIQKITENEVMVWTRAISSIIRFNIDTFDVGIEISLDVQKPYLDAIYGGDAWWLIPHKKGSQIIRISQNGKSISYYSLPVEIKSGDYTFADAQLIDENIVLFPKVCNIGLCINTTTDEIKSIKGLKQFSNEFYDDISWNFRSSKSYEKLAISFSTGNMLTVILDLEKNEVYSKDFRLSYYSSDKNDDMKIFLMTMENEWNSSLFPESDFFKLREMIKDLIDNNL